jgi:hypothetical protein
MAGGRSADRGTTNAATELAGDSLGVNTDEAQSGAVADVTFVEQDRDGFGENLIPLEAEESNKNLFDFK